MAEPPKHILLVAGDPSGDEHAAALVRALKHRFPQVRISALGGNHLRDTADAFIYPLVGLGGFGFWEPLLKLPALWRVKRQIEQLLEKDRPDVVIPVDYYGFNIHVARAAKKRNIPVAYFISPQVWASRPERVQELGKAVTAMLVIFPFEKSLYEKARVPVAFVGHPLLDKMPAPVDPAPRIKIGLLPGSRLGIVKRHLPILTKTAAQLKAAYPEADIVMFRPREIPEELYYPFIREGGFRPVYESDYAERKTLTLAIGVSGTAALENTLLGIPMIIMYKLSSLTYAIAKQLVQVPYIGIPNLLAGTGVVPELLQADATPENLVAAARRLLDNPKSRQDMRYELLALRATLGQAGTLERAVDEIEKMHEIKR